MIIIILIIVFGVLFSIFATQNTAAVNIYAGNFVLNNIPVYILVLASIAIGVGIAAFYYFTHYLSTSLTMGEQKEELKKTKNNVLELTKQVHELELENTKLRVENGDGDFDEEKF